MFTTMMDPDAMSPSEFDKKFGEYVSYAFKQSVEEKMIERGAYLAGGGVKVGVFASYDALARLPETSAVLEVFLQSAVFSLTGLLTFVKHKGYTQLTKESIKHLAEANELGVGNRKIAGAIDDTAADYMNSLIETAQGSTDRGSKPSLDKISVDGNNLHIPMSLYQKGQINTYIDDGLKGYVKMEDGQLVVPKNVPIRIYNASTDTGSILTINIGSTFTDKYGDDRDLSLMYGRHDLVTNPELLTWLGDPDAFEAPGEFDMDSVKKTIQSLDAQLQAVGVTDCPFTGKVPRVDTENVYFDAFPTVSVTPPVSYAGGVLKLPKYGTLDIVKDKSGNLRADYKYAPLTTLKLGYKIEGVGYSNGVTFTEAFVMDSDSSLADAKRDFGGVDAKLKNAETGKDYNAFARFMDYTQPKSRNAQDMQAAAKEALTIIDDELGFADPLYERLQTLSSNGNLTARDQEELAYSLSKLKVIFAMSDRYESRAVSSLLSSRTGSFDKMVKDIDNMDTDLHQEIKRLRTEFARETK